jgi:hypothetical protein
MHLMDVLLENETNDAAIEHALAGVLDVPPDSVHVLDRLEPGSVVAEGATALVERRPVRGDAALRLTVILQDDGLIARTAPRRVELGLLKGLAARLRTAVLTDDGALDPSGFLRLHPDGTVEAVVLDDARLDEEGYVSTRSERQPRAKERPAAATPRA